MMHNTTDTHTISQLLKNTDLKIILDSPENDYRLEYFTTFAKDKETGEHCLARTYRLKDLVRGGITSEPWDTFNHDRQVTLITNLINFGNYRIIKVICGLEIKCSACNQTMRIKTWESIPKRCGGRNPEKCESPIDSSNITEVLFTANSV